MRAGSKICRFRTASPSGPCGIDSGIWGLAFEKPWKGVTTPPGFEERWELRVISMGIPALLASRGLRSAYKERKKRFLDAVS